MKLSQTFLPVLATLSLALTPACTQKPAEKPALTERDRKLCDLAIRYARSSIGAVYVYGTHHPDKVSFPLADDSQRELIEKLSTLDRNLILAEEMLIRNCDERFNGEKPELRTSKMAEGFSDESTVPDMLKEIDTLSSTKMPTFFTNPEAK